MTIHTPRIFLDLSTVRFATKLAESHVRLFFNDGTQQEVNQPQDVKAIWDGLEAWRTWRTTAKATK